MCYNSFEVINMVDKPYVVDGQRLSKDDYNRLKFDRFLLTVEKGKGDIITAYARARGISRNEYINKLIDEDMKTAGQQPE